MVYVLYTCTGGSACVYMYAMYIAICIVTCHCILLEMYIFNFVHQLTSSLSKVLYVHRYAVVYQEPCNQCPHLETSLTIVFQCIVSVAIRPVVSRIYFLGVVASFM